MIFNIFRKKSKCKQCGIGKVFLLDGLCPSCGKYKPTIKIMPKEV